eukprot:CAMPEP_0119277994 /NCGR_PEP_ID=MMETSP1329-20130426/18268_1 /TAXON_ID=114041 /ORGANISM="Genus nov. species nov., Strain RCC1024" /LENGTH=521 /DNA_ID=CAMNT_0007278491 /DNA_START=166 /DNA_END=1728 /DNA_ORIENTATION=+
MFARAASAFGRRAAGRRTRTALRSATVDAYETLKKELREVARLQEIEGILSYDEQVFMAPGSAASRAAQKEALAGMIHAKKTGESMRAAVDAVRGLALDDPRAAANCRDAVLDLDYAARKSKELAEREARLESECFVSWKGAREASDFSSFAPALTEMMSLKREVATATRPELCATEPYDGALDQFERGMTSERLDEIFGATRERLAPLLANVLARKKASPDADAPHPALAFDHPGWAGSAEAQAKLAERVAGDLGFDFEKGRFDVSTHPFTGGACPDDTRITTRYSDANWLEGFAGTVHEVGHALYEQGRATDEDADGLPVSKALSMGTHESQSLLWERMVLQSRAFWDYATPLFHEYFPHTKDASADDFYRAINRVQPGCIRIEADELSYPFHVFLRYDIERALFAGTLEVDKLPQMWDDTMREFLDVTVPDAANGCLQDIHWSFGAVGYFPSYTLGAIMAAQIYDAAGKAIPDLESKIRAGEFSPLRDWLQTEIHAVGSLYANPDDLLKKVTGGALTP